MMTKGNNDLLLGIALLDRLEPKLKIGTREQYNTVDCNNIKQYVVKALQYITNCEATNLFVNAKLFSIVECIEAVVDNPGFIETDITMKEVIVDNFVEAREELYLIAGKYYTDHDFDYSVRLENLLIKIVDKCIEKGYYFGIVA